MHFPPLATIPARKEEGKNKPWEWNLAQMRAAGTADKLHQVRCYIHFRFVMKRDRISGGRAAAKAAPTKATAKAAPTKAAADVNALSSLSSSSSSSSAALAAAPKSKKAPKTKKALVLASKSEKSDKKSLLKPGAKGKGHKKKRRGKAIRPCLTGRTVQYKGRPFIVIANLYGSASNGHTHISHRCLGEVVDSVLEPPLGLPEGPDDDDDDDAFGESEAASSASRPSGAKPQTEVGVASGGKSQTIRCLLAPREETEW